MDIENKHISNINRFNDIIDTYIVVYNKYVSKNFKNDLLLQKINMDFDNILCNRVIEFLNNALTIAKLHKLKCDSIETSFIDNQIKDINNFIKLINAILSKNHLLVIDITKEILRLEKQKIEIINNLPDVPNIKLKINPNRNNILL